ncbi:MAG: hypothetical protein KDA78_09035, partial [Planctomycetaceae bacterium]|nr:hypothetical protein [Planctomycetaceae bacterium]
MIEQSTRNVPVSKPSSTSEDWLSMTCEQLSNGQVQVEYIPQLGNSKLPAPHFNISSAESSEDFAWERVIRKGPELSGRIRIRIHPSVPCDREFLKVCTLADRLVDVAEEEHQNHLQAERAAAEVSRDQLLDELETPDRLPDLVRNSLMKLLELTGYRGAAFFRLDENVSRLSLVEYQHKNLSEVPGPVRILGESNADDEALLQGSASHVREDSEDPWLPAEARTGFCVVIRISTGPIGTLWAYDRRLRRLDDRDYHVLQSIAGAMGRMIEQMLFRRQNSDNFRMSRELRLASMSQPSREIEFQSAGGEFEATGCCLSRYDVGGDLCELIPLDERFVLVAVGDASGNSLPAAMVMTSVRGGLYAM